VDGPGDLGIRLVVEVAKLAAKPGQFCLNDLGRPCPQRYNCGRHLVCVSHRRPPGEFFCHFALTAITSRARADAMVAPAPSCE
jgi:hypothetical protein